MNIVRRENLGTVHVDCGDVVCVPMDAIYDIMRELKIDFEDNYDRVDHYIKKIGGVKCGFGCDGPYRISSIEILDRGEFVASGTLVDTYLGDDYLV